MPRLLTDNDSTPDMNATSSAGAWTYYEITPSTSVDGSYYLTLPSGPVSFQRLRVLADGSMDFNTVSNQGINPSLRFVEANNGDNVVHIKKRNSQGFAIDGMGGSANAQNIYLWAQNINNVNQQWVEIDRGNGYYSYQKQGTNHCIDGNGGGANQQNVYLWQCAPNNHNQHWQKVSTDSGFYKLIKRNAPGFAINGGSGGVNGQNVNLYDSSNNSHNLQWSIE